MEQVFVKVTPIIVLIVIGYIIKRTQYLDTSFFKNIKKIVYDLALPSILFISYLNIELKAEHIILTLYIILLFLALNGFGRLVNRIEPISNLILPYLLSGAPIALVGIPLFSTAFGAENVTNLATFVIGNEIFVWFIFLPLLRLEFAGEKFSFKGLISIFKSPLILSILTGILLNLLELSKIFLTNPILAGIYQTLGNLAQLGTPLIFLIIGYDLKFNREYAKMTVIYTMIRRVRFMGFGLLMSHFIVF